MDRKPCEPEKVFGEYESGRSFKSGLGRRGLYEQGKINERFYVGDQWHGAQCGNDRPLVRHNVIKRIGDYKMAVISSNPVTVNYSVEGVPNTVAIRDRVREERDRYAGEQRTPMDAMGLQPEEETAVTMSALTDYFKTTAERVKLDDLKEQALRNAYISGSGVLYTYWDDRIRTGLYADESGTTPITGDIACEVLDIENVYFGDPNLYELQEQPYILIAQRKSVKELRREARRNGRPVSDIEAIKPDRDTGHMAGDRSDDEPEETRKATVITKLWKEWDKDGSCRIMAAVVVKGAIIRAKWDTKLRLYPLSVFRWERRRNCAYGESEITYLIPNQIAINRMITASVWAVLTLGMPITLVNKNMIPYATVTNDPGQILEVENIGTGESIGNALGYVNPPNFSPAFDNNITSLISNTLSQSGANDAALGDVRPDNTSAIIAVREAATMPMQSVQNRFYSFIEDVARVWADMWVSMYGKRSLKIEDENGTWYMPFDGEKYRNLLISTKIDVGASTMWSEIQSVKTLDNLLASQIITPRQYLERLPKGSVPNLSGLIREMQEAERAAEIAAQQSSMGQGPIGQGGVDAQSVIDGLSPEYRAVFDAATPEEQAALLAQIGVTA